MPSYPQPVGRNQGLPTFWNAIVQAIRREQQRSSALIAGAQATNTVDQYGNTTVIAGQLNQTVTIGAKFGQAGVLVGTSLPGAGQPNAGTAVQQALATGTLTTTKGSTAATLVSTISGTFTSGQVIGAADVTDPGSGLATPAITPGTTFTIAGSAVTLSQVAAESGTGLYCAACSWKPQTSF